MVQTTQNLELFDQKKKKEKFFFFIFLNQLWQSVDAILEYVSVTETIVWYWTINFQSTVFRCSKN